MALPHAMQSVCVQKENFHCKVQTMFFFMVGEGSSKARQKHPELE